MQTQIRIRRMAVVSALFVLLVGTSSLLAQDLTCKQCHNDTTLITGKHTAWAESVHGTGTAYARGTSASCAGCHSGGGFSKRIAAGLDPDEVTEGDPNPTRQDCRACHQIHTTYTDADFALETTEPVTLFAIEGAVYDGGLGNLCVNCHQPRRDAPVAVDGMVTGISGHWGPHHGPQSAMLLGVAGYGVEGEPSLHYQIVGDTCVTCHMGENRDHHYEPSLANCVECHDEAEEADDFDFEGVQTDVKAMLADLKVKLIAKGLLDEEDHPIVTEAPEAEAGALWNYIYVAHEDKSFGVHNPEYTKALLQAALAALGD